MATQYQNRRSFAIHFRADLPTLLNIWRKSSSTRGAIPIQEIVEHSRKLSKPFSASHVTQILGKLTQNGLVYKNRHGRYSLAVPLLGEFILRYRAAG